MISRRWTGPACSSTTGLGGAGWRPVEACVIAEELGRAHDSSPWFGIAMAAAAFASRRTGSVTAGWPARFPAQHRRRVSPPMTCVARRPWGDSRHLAVVAAAQRSAPVDLSDADNRWPDRDAFDFARPLWCVDIRRIGVLIGSTNQAQRLMAIGRLLVSADAIGALSSTLARLTAYLKERIAFGAPIASFQAVQHRLVDLLVLEVKSRAIVSKAARAGIGRYRHERPANRCYALRRCPCVRGFEDYCSCGRVHAVVRRYRIHLGVSAALRAAAGRNECACFLAPLARVARCLPRYRDGERLANAGPPRLELNGFRNRVRAFIAEHAPPIEAREGHRAPVDAAAGVAVARLVCRPVRCGLHRCRLARRIRRPTRPPSTA